MNIKQVINPKTLLLPSLFLNTVLLATFAYFSTERPEFYQSAPIVVLTNAPPTIRTISPTPAARERPVLRPALAVAR